MGNTPRTQESVDYIKKSKSLIDIPVKYLPPVFDTNYLFISYSHKDYKAVYEDIFALQKEGLQLWYDRDMRPGSSWRAVARSFMVPYECKGIIFYLSENSLKSEATIGEIEFAKKLNKPIIPIVLPIDSSEKENESGASRAILSPLEIIFLLEKQGMDADNISFIKESMRQLLPDEILYLPLNAEISRRAEQIRLKMNEEPVLTIEGGTIIKANDSSIVEVDKDLLRPLEPWAKEKGYITVGASSFARCVFLSRVDLLSLTNNDGKEGLYPLSFQDYAFANCSYLERILSPISIWADLGNFVFLNNEKLISFGECDVYNPVYLSGGNGSFKNCTSLEEINVFGGRIGDECFYNCVSLKNIKIHNASLIGNWAFYNASSLESIELPPDILSIGRFAFGKCRLLKEITIPKNVTAIGSHAFHKCEQLETLIIRATRLNWSGSSLFDEHNSLKTLIISDDVTVLPDNMLLNAKNVKCESVPDSLLYVGTNTLSCLDESYYFEEDGMLYLGNEKNNHFVLCKVIDKERAEYHINKYCRIIAGEAFAFCKNVVRVDIPPSIISIGSRAFYGCLHLRLITQSTKDKRNWLSQVNDPFCVGPIGNNAFYGCPSLESVILETAFSEIGSCAFLQCPNLRYVKITTDNLQKIGVSIFDESNKLLKAVCWEGKKEIWKPGKLSSHDMRFIEIESNNEVLFEKEVLIEFVYNYLTHIAKNTNDLFIDVGCTIIMIISIIVLNVFYSFNIIKDISLYYFYSGSLFAIALLFLFYSVFSLIVKAIWRKRKKIGRVNLKKRSYEESFVNSAMITQCQCIFWMDKESIAKFYPLASFLNKYENAFVVINIDNTIIITKGRYIHYSQSSENIAKGIVSSALLRFYLPIDEFSEEKFESDPSQSFFIGPDSRIISFELYTDYIRRIGN